MYYSDSVRHLLLTPITKYKFTRIGTLYKTLLTSVSRNNTNTCIMEIAETLVTNTYY